MLILSHTRTNYAAVAAATIVVATTVLQKAQIEQTRKKQSIKVYILREKNQTIKGKKL